jgi:hypothetical protein
MNLCLSVWREKIHWDILLGRSAKETEITHDWVKSRSWEYFCAWSHSVTQIRSCRGSLGRRIGPSQRHNTHYTRYKHLCPGRIRTRSSTKRAAFVLRLRSRDRRNRRVMLRGLSLDEVGRLCDMRVEKGEFLLNSGTWWKIVFLKEFYFLNIIKWRFCNYGEMYKAAQ